MQILICSPNTMLGFRNKYYANSKKTTGWRNRQNLIHRTLLAMTEGPIKVELMGGYYYFD